MFLQRNGAKGCSGGNWGIGFAGEDPQRRPGGSMSTLWGFLTEKRNKLLEYKIHCQKYTGQTEITLFLSHRMSWREMAGTSLMEWISRDPCSFHFAIPYTQTIVLSSLTINGWKFPSVNTNTHELSNKSAFTKLYCCSSR